MKHFYFLRGAMAMTLSFVSISALALEFEADGFKFNTLTNKTVELLEPVKKEADLSGEITIPQTVVNGEVTYTVTCISMQAFSMYEHLTKITLPPTIDSLGYSAFSGCYALEQINLGETKIRVMPEYVFSACRKLKAITIPATVTQIVNNPFAQNKLLKAIDVAEGNKNYTSIDGLLCTIDKKKLLSYPGGKSKDAVVPDGIECIGNSAFNTCQTITSCKLPESVTRIENSAFTYCDSMKVINIPQKVEFIGMSAFSSCKVLDIDVKLPETLEFLGNYAFQNTSIKSINFPAAIEVIPSSVAYACTKLKNITIAEGITMLNEGCFRVTAIKEIVVPNSVTTIGTAVFDGCTLLQNVTLGSGIKKIGLKAFNGLKNISAITSLAQTPPTLGSTAKYPAFTEDVMKNATLYVPKEAMGAYKAADIWKNFEKFGDSEVGEITSEDAGVFVSGLTVSIPEDKIVQIFNMSGIAVYNGNGGVIDLPAKGIYILRINGKTLKLAVG